MASSTSSDLEHYAATLTPAEVVALRIRGYIIGDYLSAGSFGAVFKATRYGAPCAVKMIPICNETCQDVVREMFLLKQTAAHPNIVTPLDLFLVRCQEVLIFMEMMAGGDLHDYLAAFSTPQAPLPEKPVLASLFKQMASGLFYMHRQGFAHRDLKPANILLDGDYKIAKIADFGLSAIAYNTITGEKLLCESLSGTIEFIAPEVYYVNSRIGTGCGKSTYDPFIADIWSLGVILYQMIHGTPSRGPFYDWSKIRKIKNEMTRNEAALKKIFDSPIQYGGHLSEAVKNLCSKMLEKKAKERITLIAILNHEWLE